MRRLNSSRTRPARVRPQGILRSISGWLLWLAAVSALVALAQRHAAILSAATCLFGAACVARDWARVDRARVEPITLFALSLSITGFADVLGFLSVAKEGPASPYALYLDQRFIFFTAVILAIGGVATIGGYRYVSSFGGLPILSTPLPLVRGQLEGPLLIPGGIAVAVLGMIVRFLPPSSSLGTIGSLVAFGPNLVVFALARIGFSRGQRQVISVALVIALTESIRAALFEYLRSDMVVPLFAFALAALIGSRTLRILRTRPFIPIYVMAVTFGIYFSIMGKVRTTGSTGLERVVAVTESQQLSNEEDESENGLMVRLTALNQLSQIGRLVQQGGYLRGQTLSYLGFAFVPRFLWPDKPTVAKGQWFAFRIGQASEKPDGSYTNAVNMTVPGELYLNFGWFGVILGCFALGALLAVLWSRAAFWDNPNNVLGSAFGFYLLWTAFGAGADLQIVVTLIAMYLLFLAASVCGTVMRRRPRGTRLNSALISSPADSFQP